MGAGFSIKAKANQEADIFLYEDIGSEGIFGFGVTAKQFAADLKALGDVRTINLRINSMGGDVYDGFTIYRMLVDHKARIVSYIDGVGASIASVIAMAGDEINISEAGFMMIHNATGLAVGSSDDMRNMADRLDTTSATIADVYLSRTKNDINKIKKWMADETWFTGEDAVKNGFADRMMENMKVSARLDPAKHKYRHAPQALLGTPNLDAIKQRIALMRAEHERHRAKAASAPK